MSRRAAILEAPAKASPSHCPPTATPPSWADLAIAGELGRHGFSPAPVVSGPSRVVRSWGLARLAPPKKAIRSRTSESYTFTLNGNVTLVADFR